MRLVLAAAPIGLFNIAGVAFACSPPPPRLVDQLHRASAVIVRGDGVFGQKLGGGSIAAKRVLKGPRSRSFVVKIEYKAIGTCPPMNALQGRQSGTFFLSGTPGDYRILKFEQDTN